MPAHFLAVLKRLSGTVPGFWGQQQVLFWQTNAKKGPFFSLNRWFWNCFERAEEQRIGSSEKSREQSSRDDLRPACANQQGHGSQPHAGPAALMTI